MPEGNTIRNVIALLRDDNKLVQQTDIYQVYLTVEIFVLNIFKKNDLYYFMMNKHINDLR